MLEKRQIELEKKEIKALLQRQGAVLVLPERAGGITRLRGASLFLQFSVGRQIGPDAAPLVGVMAAERRERREERERNSATFLPHPL